LRPLTGYANLIRMSQKGWVGWALANRAPALGFALCLVVATADLGVIAARSGGEDSQSTEVVAGPEDDGDADTTTTVPLAPGETTTTTAAPGPGATTATTARDTTGPSQPTGPTVPGTTPAPPCTPDPNYRATGIDDKKVVIGQIVSDVSFLPAHLYPNHEGLAAYVRLVNDSGGVCGRKIEIKYSNDNAAPATHEYESMTHQVFAFVANSSLIDGLDYQSDKPFNPTVRDNGEFVPDVGGLAYSYGRNQSPMFAGVLGSLSPSLVGGGAPKVMVEEAKTKPHGPCRKAGIVYLREPTGASEDAARVGGVALAADWGANFGSANVKFYVANLADPVTFYEQMVNQMVLDGVNCAFTYADLGSNINLVRAMGNQRVWPPAKCTRGRDCFPLIYMPFAGYDPKFIRDAGEAAQEVTTFLPHTPLNETGDPAMQTYLAALKKIPDAEPSTFSVIGWTSGIMFVEALAACGSAPTRACVMDYLRGLKDFTGGGLLGGTTPFRTTRVRCNGDCGSFQGRGVYDWKWIFNCWTMMRVQGNDFRRVHPASGFRCDEMRVARGTPA
jgi:hypothetical protein